MAFLENNKTFCILPWIHVEIQQGGNCTTCCKTQLKNDLGTLKEKTLLEIANSTIQCEIRYKMLNGEKINYCLDCYEDESLGHLSLRQKSNRYYAEEIVKVDDNTEADGSLKKFIPKYLGLRFSNLCNLRCVYCNSIYSSSIEDEFSMGELKTFASKLEIDEFVLNYCNEIESFYIAGGEPLLDPMHDYFIEKLIDFNYINTRLTYNTNLSIPLKNKEKLIENWKKFKSVIFCASLDLNGKKGEEIRRGLRWNIAEDNIRLMTNEFGRQAIIIYLTITSLNVHHIISFFKYLFNNELASPDSIIINFLRKPEVYSVENTLMEEAKLLQEEFNTFKKYLLACYDLEQAYPLVAQINSIQVLLNDKKIHKLKY